MGLRVRRVHPLKSGPASARRSVQPEGSWSSAEGVPRGVGAAIASAMTIAYWLGGLLSLALFAYLLYALLWAEKF